MLFGDDEHSGIFSSLVGLTVLVMAGVALSLVVDRKFKFSSQTNEIRQEIDYDAAEIEGLESRKGERDRQLSESSHKLQTTSLAHQGNVRELAALTQRNAKLERSRSDLSRQIGELESGFSNYRSEYRRKSWERAIGERLGDLVLSDGRRYLQATISRVTDVGLEIRHEDGIARIQAPDLAPELQNRFQWNDEVRRQRLNEEMEKQPGKTAQAAGQKASKPTVSNENRIQRVNATEEAEARVALRRKVTAWKAKISKLQSEKLEAESRAQYDNQASAPGSLETWSAKAARLGSELSRARSALAVAKSDLEKVSPGDSMLAPDHRDF
jgi:cell division protein FtsB